jgi:hypothetical protein
MDDKNLEDYLAEFRPRPVRALETPRQIERVQLWLVATAATIVLGGVAIWYLLPDRRDRADVPATQQILSRTELGQSDLNVIALTKLALEDEERFEALLVDKSRTVLPNFQGKNSVLRVLTKE